MEMWQEDIAQIESENKLIVLVFHKYDADNMEDDLGNPYNLTDEQWEYVRNKFYKSNQYIVDQCWNLIDDLVIHAKGAIH